MNRFFDITILILLSPIVMPLILVIILVAKIFHGSDIFFFQKRLGKDKKEFKLVKFRSMVVDAQHRGTGLYSYIDDDRITPLGKFLRKTSLDELPQLYNILRGDMSFVGPRPAVVGELEQEIDLPDNINLRFLVKPGLTGWAQVHGRDNLSWTQKGLYDIEFVTAKGFTKIKMIIFVLLYTPLYLFHFSATYEKK